ncbi:hypothetical protein SB860_35045, partial [Burkholderia sp. SIMBA_019]
MASRPAAITDPKIGTGFPSSLLLKIKKKVMNFESFASPAFFENPYPLYDQIRNAGALLPLGPNIFFTGQFTVIDALLRD